MKNYSPIVLFVYNRPWHTRQTVEALQKNFLAGDSELYIYSDAPKTEEQSENVNEVRKYIQSIDGFKLVTVVNRNSNMGLASSIIDGVTKIVNNHGKIIVLEDDMVTSPYFLTYMNEALDKYADDERVVSIHGYVYPVEKKLPEAFFLPGADCWGWATWSRGWALFNPDGKFLLNEMKKRHLTKGFDYNGSYPYTKMLEDQISGKNDSWAIRWYASAFLDGKLTLYPGRSLVHNIGNDDSGIHCRQTGYDVNLSEHRIDLSNVLILPSKFARAVFMEYFKKNGPGVLDKIKIFIRSMIKSAKI